MVRKPNICVLDKADQFSVNKAAGPMHWRKIFAIVEVTAAKASQSVLKGILGQISEKAACIFDVQPQRRFTCALAFLGKPDDMEFIFVVVDRSSLIYTPAASLHSTQALSLLRIIFAFCFAVPETLGWDPAVVLNPFTKEATHIKITGYARNSITLTTQTFKIVNLIHSSAVLYSRGTRVWIVSDEDGRFYVLKDSWIQGGRQKSEIDFVNHIEDIIENDPEGYLYKYICPTYSIGQDTVWNTDNIREYIPKSHTRRHRRIVTGPIGDPITSFRSKTEFVSAFLDIVNGIFFVSSHDNQYTNFYSSIGLSSQKGSCSPW